MTSQRIDRNHAIGAALGVTLTLSGCATNNIQTLDNVPIKDSDSTLVSATVVIRPEQWSRRDGRDRTGVEFGYERQTGSGSQYLPVNHYVTFDEFADPSLSSDRTLLAGPQTLHSEALIEHGHIAYNRLFSFGKHFEVEPAAGIAFDKMTIKLFGDAPDRNRLSTVERFWGVTVGVVPRWNFNRFLSAECKIRIGVGLRGYKNSSTTNIVPAITLRPVENLAIIGGYAFRDQSADEYFSGNDATHYVSVTNMSFRGPSAAVTVTF